MKRTDMRTPFVGGSSLITIFAILCMIVFTLLTLSTVTSSRDLALSSYNAVTAYYNADSEAEKIFAQLRSGIIPEGVIANGNYYSYKCPISETQFISVELSLIDDEWNIISWNSTSLIQ
ncbi:MAG: hypothetical protein E7477_01115 [Ruminococcaceae bacterium]|nr:hypothetical protein [Oscillospiraceae bacterium]